LDLQPLLVPGKCISAANAPHAASDDLLFLFFDTHFLLSGSKNCLSFFGLFTLFTFSHQIFHRLHSRSHLRVRAQEEKDASQEASPGGEASARQARKQLEDRYRE
jgi:hypothetical protein